MLSREDIIHEIEAFQSTPDRIFEKNKELNKDDQFTSKEICKKLIDRNIISSLKPKDKRDREGMILNACQFYEDKAHNLLEKQRRMNNPNINDDIEYFVSTKDTLPEDTGYIDVDVDVDEYAGGKRKKRTIKRNKKRSSKKHTKQKKHKRTRKNKSKKRSATRRK